MHETGKKLLNLMFRPGETVCVSHNKFGYHSVPLEAAMDGIVTLVPREDVAEKLKISFEESIEKIDTRQLTLCALNPIDGYRTDQNCTAFRNFLVELDHGPLKEQKAYVENLGLPVSASVFSGSKSLHYLISLDTDLPSEDVYRMFSEWILNIANMADQNTKNPSRSIRIPGAYREPQKKQLLVDFKGPVKLSDLVVWLSKHPDAKPKERQIHVAKENPDIQGLKMKSWVADKLYNGIDVSKGRNQEWFGIACELCLQGVNIDDTIDVLSEFFTEDHDFKRKEWESAIKSGFNHIANRTKR